MLLQEEEGKPVQPAKARYSLATFVLNRFVGENLISAESRSSTNFIEVVAAIK